MRVVVTGANRGIGLEFVRQLLVRGNTVDAGTRNPKAAKELEALRATHLGKLTIGACDVTSDASVAAFAASLADGGVDLLVNNAGVTGKKSTVALDDLDPSDMLATYDANALGPVRVTRAILPKLRQAHGKILNISTGMASVGDNGRGGSWGYRMSKAALNMATRNIAIALRPDGIACAAVNPGWVRTDMGGADAIHRVEDSVVNLLRIADGLTMEQSGSFFHYDGKPFPW